MANYFNVFAGVLTFLGSSSLFYVFWNIVIEFVNYFPTELRLMSATLWIMLGFTAIVYMPFIMMVSDDRGA